MVHLDRIPDSIPSAGHLVKTLCGIRSVYRDNMGVHYYLGFVKGYKYTNDKDSICEKCLENISDLDYVNMVDL